MPTDEIEFTISFDQDGRMTVLLSRAAINKLDDVCGVDGAGCRISKDPSPTPLNPVCDWCPMQPCTAPVEKVSGENQ